MPKVKISKEVFKKYGSHAYEMCKKLYGKAKKYSYAEKFKALRKKIKTPKVLSKNKPGKKIFSFFRYLFSSWKMVVTFVPLFLFFYYVLGSYVEEEVSLSEEYNVKDTNSSIFSTTDTMAFLVKHEIDDKMWTPNLPIIFPAYVLDNMPNFQIGIISAVKNTVSVLRKFNNTEMQKKDIKEAYQNLNYSPYIWIMTRQDKFKLAPSSNSKYRKAVQNLRKYGEEGIFVADVKDLKNLLQRLSRDLQKLIYKNEEYVQEHSSDWTDFKSDDLFYHNRGYAYALWQIYKTLGSDYKNIILNNDLYESWTYLLSALKKTAEFKPLIIRNGNKNSLFSPNHLLIQNYYLQRAISAAQEINYGLLRGEYAHQD